MRRTKARTAKSQVQHRQRQAHAGEEHYEKEVKPQTEEQRVTRKMLRLNTDPVDRLRDRQLRRAFSLNAGDEALYKRMKEMAIEILTIRRDLTVGDITAILRQGSGKKGFTEEDVLSHALAKARAGLPLPGESLGS